MKTMCCYGNCVGTTVRPGARLVIRGYSGNVLEKNVIYRRSYQVNGVQFIAYERADGVCCSVDAARVEPAEDAACVQFSERLSEALTILTNIGENYCGDLTEKQAMKFHKAVAKLAAIEREVGYHDLPRRI